jgi:hypothetical protein
MAQTLINNLSYSTLDATKLSGNLPAISGASLTGISGGISQYQQWRLTSALNSNASDADISSNLEIVDTNSPQTLGGNMTQSGGVFTFPSTGVYLITFQGQAYQPSGDDDRGVKFKIKTTTNNGTFTIAAQMYQVMSWTNNNNQPYASATISCIFDVTDTSTHKVLFGWGSSQGTTIYLRGDTSETNTNFQFMKLGDT